MSKIGKKVANWVESLTDVADALGITPASLHTMLNGRLRLPLKRFTQIVYHTNPPQPEVDEILNMYLEDLNIPENSMRLIRANSGVPGSALEGSVIRDAKIVKITEQMMSSSIPADAKVKIYSIIQSTMPGQDGENPAPSQDALSREARIAKILELVMSADIVAEAKVKVFNIIQATKKK